MPLWSISMEPLLWSIPDSPNGISLFAICFPDTVFGLTQIGRCILPILSKVFSAYVNLFVGNVAGYVTNLG